MISLETLKELAEKFQSKFPTPWRKSEDLDKSGFTQIIDADGSFVVMNEPYNRFVEVPDEVLFNFSPDVLLQLIALASSAAPQVVAEGPSAEDYSDMLRAFFFNYAAGGYNDAGGLVPLETAKDKLEWIVNEAIRHAAPVQPVAVPDGTITLTGHQLRMALDLISPGIPWDRDELDDDLTFGIRQHEDDDGKVSTGMCCWNDDTDGVLPLDGEYEAPAAPAAQGDALPCHQELCNIASNAAAAYGEFPDAGLIESIVKEVRAAIAAKAAS